MTGNVIFTGNISTQGDVTLGNGTTDTAKVSGDLNIQDIGNLNVASLTSNSTGQQTLDTVAKATYRTCKWLVSVTNTTDGDYQAIEILCFHDGTTAYLTQYASIFDNGAQATFDADISGSNLRLRVTPASTDNMTFKAIRQAIEV
jgi:hypothetical protein